MELDDLQSQWQHLGQHRPGAEAAFDAVKARATELERTIRRRDRRELAAAVASGGFFGFFGWRTPHLVSAVGAGVIVATCLAIPIVLRRARRPVDFTLPAGEAFEAELDRIGAQQRLLRSVSWWYLGPLYLGLVLFVLGAGLSWIGGLVVAGATALFWRLRRFNHDAARALDAQADEVIAIRISLRGPDD